MPEVKEEKTVSKSEKKEKGNRYFGSSNLYSAQELARYHKFAVPKEVVLAALKRAGKKETSLAEAEKLVEEFLKKEVK